MKLPQNYDELTPAQRREVREEYVRRQGGRCSCCGGKLDGEHKLSLTMKDVDAGLFPPKFFDWPVHLHHCHDTGLTLGAVHAFCNAVLWQHYNE